MNKVLATARKITDKPTFISSIGFFFTAYSLILSVFLLIQDTAPTTVLALVIVLVLAALSFLAIRDDWKDARAYAKNRKQKQKVSV